MVQYTCCLWLVAYALRGVGLWVITASALSALGLYSPYRLAIFLYRSDIGLYIPYRPVVNPYRPATLSTTMAGLYTGFRRETQHFKNRSRWIVWFIYMLALRTIKLHPAVRCIAINWDKSHICLINTFLGLGLYTGFRRETQLVLKIGHGE